MEQQCKELSKAMAAAFPEILKAMKEKENPHFRSKYADLTNVIDAIKPSIAPHGLWFTQVMHNVPGFAAVETIIIHESGESLSCGIVSVPVTKQDAQGYGSALTYARRYGLSAAFGVAPDDVGGEADDDGNAACEKPKPAAKAPAKKLPDNEIFLLASEVIEMLKPGVKAEELEKIVGFLKYWQENSRSPLRDLVHASIKQGLFIEYYLKWQKGGQRAGVKKIDDNGRAA